jgi:ketosteroid isomerase-like protein
MGQAREIMDRVTAAVLAGDRAALEELYAPDAVGESADQPRLEGAAAIVDWLLAFRRAIPDMAFESLTKYEAGDVAIDEGYLAGTHTGVLSAPDGDVAPTGNRLRLRQCDVLTVADGRAVAHHFYFDQLEFLTQLGLLPPEAAAGAVPRPRAGADAPSKATVR